jgi:alkanesulfonate monooxygenase
MALELVGLINHNGGSMMNPRPVSDFDRDAILKYARIQEDAGFDRVLIANSAVLPDSFGIANFVAANTTKLKLMIAHRPGFIAPTMAARMFATVDQLSGGRAAVHIIAGANDAELRADGDYLTKEERYQRCREYVNIMKSTWSAQAPVSHNGKYYKYEKSLAEVKPVNGKSIPIFWGGSSDTAVSVGTEVADIYALTGDTLAGTTEMLGKIRQGCAAANRQVDVLMTIVLILGDTEEAAWKKADTVLQKVIENTERKKRERAETEKTPSAFGEKAPVATTFQRVLQNAQAGDRVDKCFWTALTKATNAQQGNVSTLVGTAEQVADALMDYYDLGVSRFLIRGYTPMEDAAEFGRDLIPRLRRLAAARDAKKAAS